jgi:hypothetical protein
VQRGIFRSLFAVDFNSFVQQKLIIEYKTNQLHRQNGFSINGAGPSMLARKTAESMVSR